MRYAIFQGQKSPLPDKKITVPKPCFLPPGEHPRNAAGSPLPLKKKPRLAGSFFTTFLVFNSLIIWQLSEILLYLYMEMGELPPFLMLNLSLFFIRCLMKIYMLSFVFGSLAKLNSCRNRFDGSLLDHINSHWSKSLASFSSNFRYSDNDILFPYYMLSTLRRKFLKAFEETKVDF